MASKYCCPECGASPCKATRMWVQDQRLLVTFNGTGTSDYEVHDSTDEDGEWSDSNWTCESCSSEFDAPITVEEYEENQRGEEEEDDRKDLCEVLLEDRESRCPKRRSDGTEEGFTDSDKDWWCDEHKRLSREYVDHKAAPLTTVIPLEPPRPITIVSISDAIVRINKVLHDANTKVEEKPEKIVYKNGELQT